MRPLDGWTRLLLVASAVWVVFVLGSTALEFATDDGYSRFYSGLSFTRRQGEDLVLHEQNFWTLLLAPVLALLAFAKGLVPAIQWIRRGFSDAGGA